jgi:tetratricopeptide (TPR) repeat protein
LALKDYPGAESCFLAELEDYGDSCSRRRALADLYYAWGRAEDAAEQYSIAHRLGAADSSPSRPGAPELRFAALRRETCSSPEAFAMSREASDDLDRGNALMTEKRWDDAYEVFERAAAADPSCFPALNNLGVIALNQRKDFPDAVERFEAAAALSSAPALSFNLAKARSLAGKN